MRIGIVGAGAMAEALGTGWAKAGHDIVVGARDAGKATDLAARLGARAGTFAEAAAHGDAVLAALPHAAMLDVVASLADALAGRAVVDCSNPIVPGPGGLMLTTDGGPSAARLIADAAPDAHVVKAFNVCAAEVWARYADGLAVPLCGEDSRRPGPGARAGDGLGRDPAGRGRPGPGRLRGSHRRVRDRGVVRGR